MESLYISILGISGAIPSHDHDTTSLVIRNSNFSALIDCGGSPLQKIQKVNINPLSLDSVIITHRHPDHIYGLPFLLQGLGLLKRKKELRLFATEDNIDFINELINLFGLGNLVKNYLRLIIVPYTPNCEIVKTDLFSIITMPVRHGVPTIAIKAVNKTTGKSIVYSSDTSPCNELIEFSLNSKWLIHECSFQHPLEIEGHSNGRQAGRIAKLARVERLALVHLPVYDGDVEVCRKDALKEFEGDVVIPNEYDRFEF